MKINVEPGKYIVAVSGGVDSVVLLDLLLTTYHLPSSDFQFIVAHFDHGIRQNSAEDREFAQKLAEKYGLKFVYDRADLGKNASEERARKGRYKFLRSVKKEHDATAIITAHHQDDVIETMMINLLRGTDRKGLSSLKSTEHIYRPLLAYPKADIKTYAHARGLTWREDETNRDTTILRNRLRNIIQENMTSEDRQKWIGIYQKMLAQNHEIDQEVKNVSQNPEHIVRSWFIGLPHRVAREVLAAFLREHSISPSRQKIERAVIFCKVGKPHTRHHLDKTHSLIAKQKTVVLRTEREK
ncbi:MAG: tRNA lysidine(34) synthetase TilS [Candidatus Saccharibacteria bacterium]|nr:tRNA lysidine(34) synthetase TilS [Candidatus Saccharibacteria bacterium]